MLLKALLVVSFVISHSHANILPENNLLIPVESINTGINEKEFHQAIDKVEALYRPVIESKGAKLRINRQWSNERVNASATRTIDDKIWIIYLFGGLARHPEITSDAFTLVICHELGHHLGGAPKKKRGEPAESFWASTEGESDYFATLKCLRKIFENDDNERFLESTNTPLKVQKNCNNFKTSQDKAICIRSSLAGAAVARMGAAVAFRKLPQLENKDTSIVEETYPEHPQSQCRLDTYFNGAICQANFREELSDHDHSTGACFTGETHTPGSRPFCWFKPQDGKPHDK